MYLIYDRLLPETTTTSEDPPTPSTSPNLWLRPSSALSGKRPEALILSAWGPVSGGSPSVTVNVWGVVQREGAEYIEYPATWVLLAAVALSINGLDTAVSEVEVGVSPGAYYVQIADVQLDGDTRVIGRVGRVTNTP